ncbi:caspase family protein [Microcoleus sp. C2C3]|uniref:caspase family protein n=1 Tax=unclassified Microcoleus TaxID=2642155 RepID=UPI002FD6C114
MGLKRREFLQQAGRVLGAIGISEALWLRLGSRYLQALAQPTARKLALLVGVDKYPDSPLHGCVTDVDLQRELLIYRFGFVPSDILTLTDAQATRDNIETAFVTHLSEQAKPGDVVVFHFSGCGSRVSLGESPGIMQNSLVPADDVVPLLANRAVNDILEETLLLLVRELATENAIAILDTSYPYPGFPKNGNFRIRSRPRPTVGQPSLAELTFAEGLSSRPNLRPDAAVLVAGANSQLAAEQDWNGFTAGLFTYALTQTLWWATPASSFSVCFSRAAGNVEQLSGLSQQPQIRHHDLTAAPAVNFSNLMLNSPASDGAVTAVEDGGKTVRLWLGGLSPGVLECSGGSVFALDSSAGDSLGDSYASRLLLRGRTGLSAKAQVLDKPSRTDGQLTVGQLVREEIRVLPRNIGLTVALDSGLERIERVDATSAFATVPQVVAVGSEQPADCRFGRVPETTLAETVSPHEPALSQRRYGLFSLAQMLIPDTQGDGGEAVKVAVQRLTPHLKALQAGKLLRLTINEGSSRLKVRAVLATTEPQGRVVAQREPVRAEKSYRLEPLTGESEKSANAPILSMSKSSSSRCILYNDSDRPVYFAVFCSDSAGRLSVLGTEGKDSVAGMSRPIAPGENLTVPAAGAIGWAVSGPIGLAETVIIFSEKPFAQTLAAIEAEMQQTRDALPIRVLLNPLNVVRAVLEDLHAASIPGVQKVGISTDNWALDVNVWATLSFVYRVV